MRTRAARIVVVGFVLATAAPPAYAVAQSARGADVALAPGTKVRIKLRDGVRHEGRIVSVGRDTLRAAWSNGTTTGVSRTDISTLDASLGRHRPVLRGALLGTLIGGSLGAVVGGASFDPCEESCWIGPNSSGEAAGLGFIVGGTLGLAVGVAQGLFSREKWQRVALDGRLARLELISPPTRAPGLGVAVAF